MKSRVVVLQCSYQRSELKKALKTAIDHFGGWKTLFSRGEKILVKPNMLSPDPPQRAVTTHPEILVVLFELLKKEGFQISCGDSPGLTSPIFTAKKNGIWQAMQEMGVEMADFEQKTVFPSPTGGILSRYSIAAALAEKPALISVSKMKTHGFLRITGAMKNHFGIICGLEKGELHFRLRTRQQFSRMLVDLHRLFPARLYIMDGVVAMEGNGPRSGNPRQMGVILLSTDPVALDSTFCRLIAYPPEDIAAIKIGHSLELGNFSENEIEYSGDNWQNFIQPDFQIERRLLSEEREVKYPNFIRNRITSRPVLVAANCQHCQQCLQICPTQPKAISWKNNFPHFNYQHCISCFCCQEICPFQAIKISRPFLNRLLFPKR